jgi:hypothetical protein
VGRVLLVGDDWAAEYHDVELQDAVGRRLGRARLADGIARVARSHAMIGQHVDADAGPVQVVVGIETDRGPWAPDQPVAGGAVSGTERGSGARVMPPTRTPWPTWCAPGGTRCAR